MFIRVKSNGFPLYAVLILRLVPGTILWILCARLNKRKITAENAIKKGRPKCKSRHSGEPLPLTWCGDKKAEATTGNDKMSRMRYSLVVSTTNYLVCYLQAPAQQLAASTIVVYLRSETKSIEDMVWAAGDPCRDVVVAFSLVAVVMEVVVLAEGDMPFVEVVVPGDVVPKPECAAYDHRLYRQDDWIRMLLSSSVPDQGIKINAYRLRRKQVNVWPIVYDPGVCCEKREGDPNLDRGPSRWGEPPDEDLGGDKGDVMGNSDGPLSDWEDRIPVCEVDVDGGLA